MAKRTRRKPNLKNPNSRTWKKKADDLWAEVVKQVGKCEYCGKSDRRLDAHHIISRTRLRHRHDLSNGVCFCSYHHRFDPSISPHADSFGGEKFLEWLEKERTGQWLWYFNNKHDKRKPDKTYEQRYYELKEIKDETT